MLKKYRMKDIIMILLLIALLIVNIFIKDIKIFIIITIPLLILTIAMLLKNFILWNINSRKHINSEFIKLKSKGVIGDGIFISLLLINMKSNYSNREYYLEYNYGLEIEINNIVDYIKSYQNAEEFMMYFIIIFVSIIFVLHLIEKIFIKNKISNEGVLLSDGKFIPIEDIEEVFVERKAESKWREVTIKTNNKEKFLYIEEDDYCNVKKIFNLYIGNKLKESL